MAQHVSDHLARDRRPQKAGRAGMSEDMRTAFAVQCYACRLYSPADFAINANHGNVGRAGANKDFPHIRFRAAVPEVIDQGLPNRLKQRQQRMSTGLGVAEGEAFATPVDFIPPSTSYLPATPTPD